jgi:FkbM family methyltransferase
MAVRNPFLIHVRLFASYLDVFGLFGALAYLSHQLVGCPREIWAQPKSIDRPLYIRVGTSDAWLCRQILVHGQYAQNLPFTPKTIVDAGANIGLASIYYARRYPQARIISVEAEASNYAVLTRNVARYPNIVPVHAALWNRDGFVSVSQRNTNTSASEPWAFFTSEGHGVQVRAITMRTLMREVGIDSVDLFKIDIEGSEKELFESCEWVDRVRAFAIELHDHFKPGCTSAVNAATPDFSRSQHGEITLYLRP